MTGLGISVHGFTSNENSMLNERIMSAGNVAGKDGDNAYAAHSWLREDISAAWLVAAVVVLLQMATNGRYGYFRDELYYLAASDHLAWGYVDFAPLAALLLHISRTVLGDSLHAIRFLPALANGAEIILTGLIARELGGKRFAILLASVGVFMAPVILNNSSRFSMNPFEPLFWMGSVYFVLRAINGNRPEMLVWSGVLLGVGLENKHSTAFFIVSFTVGILLSPERKWFRSKWLWIAAGIILLLAVPNLIWQYRHGFPTWIDLSNVKRTHKNVELPPLPFLWQQIMALLPVNAVLWVAGLAYLLFQQQGKRYRLLGVTYLVFLAIMMALHGKDYYLAPIYPMLFAGGGVFWETLADAHSGWRWLKLALPALVLAMGAVAVPLVLPIISPDKVEAYMARLGLQVTKSETHMVSPLPQHFSDEFGWPEMVAAVAQFYQSLPAAEQAKTGILAGNYGEAGAIDFFGRKYGLPKSISAHQNYYFWGPREYTGESLILLQWDRDDAEYFCQDVQTGPTLDPQWAMGEEHYTVLLCRGMKKPLNELWPRLKHWN